MKRLGPCLLALFAALAAWGAPAEAPPVGAPHYEGRTLSPAEIDAQMAGATKYEFDLAADGGLIDAQGLHIAAKTLPDYLSANQLDPKAYYLIWVTADSPPLDAIKGLAPSLANYGVTKIVVRVRPGVTVKPSPPPPPPAPLPKPPRVITGGPLPGAIDATSPFPLLAGRPSELRPGALPPRVRYKFASDAEVIAAAALARSHLLPGEKPEGTLAGNFLWLFPGAWKDLKPEGGLGVKSAQIMPVRAPPGAVVMDLQGIILRDPGEMLRAEAEIRALVLRDGGGRVRAMRSAEMARWWPFIAFDISEPTLVLETAGGQHLFVLCFASNHLQAIDDLQGLPSLR